MAAWGSSGSGDREISGRSHGCSLRQPRAPSTPPSASGVWTAALSRTCGELPSPPPGVCCVQHRRPSTRTGIQGVLSRSGGVSNLRIRADKQTTASWEHMSRPSDRRGACPQAADGGSLISRADNAGNGAGDRAHVARDSSFPRATRRHELLASQSVNFRSPFRPPRYLRPQSPRGHWPMSLGPFSLLGGPFPWAAVNGRDAALDCQACCYIGAPGLPSTMTWSCSSSFPRFLSPAPSGSPYLSLSSTRIDIER